jgi:hypothetical protein
MQLLLKSVRFRYVLLLLVGLVLADGLITQFLITSGIAREGNTFLRGLLATGDFMPIKIAGALLSALLLVRINRHQPKMAIVTSWCFIAIYTGIVYWNITVLGLSFML